MRKILLNTHLDNATEEICNQVQARLMQKGRGAFISSHEILGVLVEEMTEFTEAVHAKSSDEEKIAELTDIAVGALLGIASIRCGGTEW